VPHLEPIEDDPHLAALAELLAAQVRDLSRVFARAFGDMLLGKTRSSRDIGRALKAQNQCRIALRLLLALRAAEESSKKTRNRTNKLLEKENLHHDQDFGQALAESPWCPDQTPPQRMVVTRAPTRSRCHDNHRADQAPPPFGRGRQLNQTWIGRQPDIHLSKRPRLARHWTERCERPAKTQGWRLTCSIC
jgi:hypothetical protein